MQGARWLVAVRKPTVFVVCNDENRSLEQSRSCHECVVDSGDEGLAVLEVGRGVILVVAWVLAVRAGPRVLRFNEAVNWQILVRDVSEQPLRTSERVVRRFRPDP